MIDGVVLPTLIDEGGAVDDRNAAAESRHGQQQSVRGPLLRSCCRGEHTSENERWTQAIEAPVGCTVCQCACSSARFSPPHLDKTSGAVTFWSNALLSICALAGCPSNNPLPP